VVGATAVSVVCGRASDPIVKVPKVMSPSVFVHGELQCTTLYSPAGRSGTTNSMVA